MENILTFRNVTHIYHTVRGELVAAQDLSFTVGRGEFVAIIGPSGLSLIHISEPTRH